MQSSQDRGIIRELIGLPVDVKQYPLENGWLIVSTVGMCFVPYPKVEKNEQERTEISEKEVSQSKVEGKKNGKR